MLVDTFALRAANAPDTPLDLLPLVSRELKEGSRSAHERVLAIMSELHARHQEFQEWYGGAGDKNPSYAKRPEFIVGAVVDRSDLPTWLALLEKHFPRSPAVAHETGERLLLEGKSWVGAPKGNAR